MDLRGASEKPSGKVVAPATANKEDKTSDEKSPEDQIHRPAPRKTTFRLALSLSRSCPLV